MAFWRQGMTAEGRFGQITDKVAHGYLPAYLRIAADLGPRARVCELGVWQGDSLRLWQSLFPLGEVTGVDSDIQAKWPEGVRQVLRRQEDPGLPAVLGGPFDLIVDDASHSGTLTALSLKALWPLVAPGGYYVIEDWFIGLEKYSDNQKYNPGMVVVAQSLLEGLDSLDSEADEITYRFGMAIIHRREE
jgi:Methyltransferase domain